jgi:hypothetical protein
MSFIVCPLPAAVYDIPVVACAANFGQVQKVIFQRMKKADGTPNEILATDAPLKATYVALKTAADSTKIQVSPFIEAPESEPGGAREFGGGNATLDGVPIILGSEASTFSAVMRSKRQDIVAAIKKYAREPDMGVFLVNEAGQIAGAADNVETPTKYTPFRIQGMHVGDMKLGGFEAPDENAIMWKFPQDWSDNFSVITPTDFLANTDI